MTNYAKLFPIAQSYTDISRIVYSVSFDWSANKNNGEHCAKCEVSLYAAQRTIPDLHKVSLQSLGSLTYSTLTKDFNLPQNSEYYHKAIFQPSRFHPRLPKEQPLPVFSSSHWVTVDPYTSISIAEWREYSHRLDKVIATVERAAAKYNLGYKYDNDQLAMFVYGCELCKFAHMPTFGHNLDNFCHDLKFHRELCPERYPLNW